MMHVIERATILFNDGTKRTMIYDVSNLDSNNTCTDINKQRVILKNKLNESLNILGISVLNIMFTYYDIDGR